MEDLMQDQETVIQQLRLLLAAKEEEMLALKGRAAQGSGGDGSDSITDRLVKEVEEKKHEISDLKARLKEVEAKAKEKLARMAAALEEKVELIASLQDRPAQAVVEDEEARRRIEELGERLKDKEALLAEARTALAEAEARAAGEGGGAAGSGGLFDEARAEILRLEGELRESRIVRANLERAAEERDRAQADAARLAAEFASAQEKLAAAERGHAERVAELQQRLDLLQGSIDAASAAAAAVQEGERSEAESLPVFQRIRTLEAELEERELSYRTTQAKLHRITQNQQILRGLCAGLCVFLIFIISMKGRPPAVAGGEAPRAASAPPPAAAEAGPAVDVAKAPTLHDSDFLPSPATEMTALETSEPARAAAPAVAEAPAAPTEPAQPSTAIPPEAETQVAARDAGRDEKLPVDIQFVEASTLALGPAAAPVVSPARGSSRDRTEIASATGGGRVPYTVKKGESLWTICQRELGNGGAMGRVARENKIANPDTVKAGDVIYLSRQ